MPAHIRWWHELTPVRMENRTSAAGVCVSRRRSPMIMTWPSCRPTRTVPGLPRSLIRLPRESKDYFLLSRNQCCRFTIIPPRIKGSRNIQKKSWIRWDKPEKRGCIPRWWWWERVPLYQPLRVDILIIPLVPNRGSRMPWRLDKWHGRYSSE